MDKMVNAYKNAVLENYANFSGRLSVPGYWWYFLANFLIVVILQILGAVSGIFVLLSFVYAIAVLVPGLAAGVRRLHDTGKSGLFLLLGLIPLVGFIILIVLLAGQGQPQVNEYGSPPVA